MEPGVGVKRAGLVAILAAALIAAVAVATSPAAAPRQIRQARRAALRDAYSGLRAVRLPPGAHPVKAVGRGLHLNGPGSVPATPDLVQLHSYFLSPWPREKVVGWFKAHPPSGARLSETGSFGIRKRKLVQYVGYEWPSGRRALDYRSLSLGIAARPGGGTAFRVDAQVVWTMPRRAAEEIPAGARFIDVKVGARKHLLKSRVISDRGEVRAIARLIDGFEVVQPGFVSCPFESGPEKEVSLIFRHSRRGPVLAEAEQTTPAGCSHALQLTIHGKNQPALEEGWLLLKRLRPVLAGGAEG